jgi:glycosyltransferase involved in cell wall biosynthesis
MAAGVCVLTSDIRENREVVDGAGYTFRRGDRSDLERMLDLLMHNPELRRQAAARGQERIKNEYRWSEIATSIERVYHHVLGWHFMTPALHWDKEVLVEAQPTCLSANGMD